MTIKIKKVLVPILLIGGIYFWSSMVSHGMQEDDVASRPLESTQKIPPKKSLEEKSKAIIEQKLVDKTSEEITQDLLNEANKSYDERPYDRLPTLPTEEERQLLVAESQPQRERYGRIQAAIEDTFQTAIILTEFLEQPNASPEQDNWEKLLDYIQKDTFKDYSFEVWYLDLRLKKIIASDIIAPDEISSYEFKSFSGQDNINIIPLTVYRPKKSLQNRKKSPVAIYMHGGPSAVVLPDQINPQFVGLARLGYTIIAPNYRGSILNPEFAALLEGHEGQYPFEDVQATLDIIKTQDDLDSKKILLTGISYGTYLNSIIIDRLGDQISGLFLHTGFYGNPSPSPFDHLLNIRQDLPIFLASGVKDYGNPDIQWSLKYTRDLQDISTNFNFFLLEQGGHHLISLINPSIKSPNLKDIDRSIERNQVNLKKIIEQAEKRYNADEFMDYVSHLIEFYDKIAHGEIPRPIQQGKILYEEKLTPQGIDIIKKAQLAREIKGKYQPSQKFGPEVLHLNES